ncbi:MAG: tRNA dihydrouridine synthase DusB, partial [Chitinophagaceae bacterium]|nr:tRNA dihydrouridine synthase DusB [Chitinophagaceae bacterium]
KTEAEINEVFDDIARHYAGYQFEKIPIELVNYHEKCPIN